jgi:hypothetical protein
MNRSVFQVAILAVLTIAVGGQSARADALGAKVQEAKEKGVEWLKARQTDDGHWENDTLTLLQPGGTSALALLALLEAGVQADDGAVACGSWPADRTDGRTIGPGGCADG